MLRKLMKYDFRGTARPFVLMYAVLLALSVANSILLSITTNAMGTGGISETLANPIEVAKGILMVLYVLTLFAVNLMTIVISMRFYYNNLFKSEGYLMHTLPVTPATLIWSKVLINAVWAFLTVTLSLFSIFLVTFNGDEWQSSDWHELVVSMQEFLKNPLSFLALLSIIVAIVSILVSCELCLCMALSVGSMVPKHHGIIAVAILIGMGILHILVPVQLITGMVNLAESNVMYRFLDALSGVQGGYPLITFMALLVTAYGAVFGAIYFAVTQFIMKKHLNLE